MDGVIVPMIASFQMQNPEVRVEQSHGYATDLSERILNGAMDLAICPMRLADLMEGWRVEPIPPGRNVIAARGGHPLSKAKSVTEADLLNCWWIAPPPGPPLLAEDSLPVQGASPRQTLRIAGVATVMRVILPGAMADLARGNPSVDFDIHESAPAEILDLLYRRRVNIGLMAANSVSEVSAGFQQIPILQDPFVLAVPEGIDLSGVTDPDRDLDAHARHVTHSVIQFVFGTQHSSRIQDWFDLVFPRNRLAMRVRSFELALDLVAAPPFVADLSRPVPQADFGGDL